LKSFAASPNQGRVPWALLLLTICTFFVLLGSRGLEEPDEGRYAEIGREMIETGNWLVPHLWYLPHFDKPPMTYWLVAFSIKAFGQNEWAVRLPVALAGLSGVWAAWLLACSIGGRRAGFWSVLILQTSVLYFAMARLLTTDIILTQFVAWAVYFFWRSWLWVRNAPKGASPKSFWLWHLGAWVAIALGFLVKGPVALAIPLAAMGPVALFRWKTLTRRGLLCGGFIAGMVLFLALAAPWFLAANRAVPGTLNYLVFHQAAGHVLGTTIKGRRGFAFYFFVVLAVGLLPWTWLLGWLWRREHWRKMPDLRKDGWLMLNSWSIFTFTLFSLTHSKLAPYILPIFPAVAVMLGVRFFGESEETVSAPGWIWRCCVLTPLLMLIAFSVAISPVYHVVLPRWMAWQAPVLAVATVVIFWAARKWRASQSAGAAVGLGILSLLVIAGELTPFEVDLKSNQTLKPLGAAVRENYHAGDTLVCWGQLPEGLPFYAGPAISATNRPFFGGMNLTRAPFEFPGNQERLGSLLLPSEEAFFKLLAGNKRVLVVVQQKTSTRLQKLLPDVPFRILAESGQWELFSNR
jgi:4-amino-4-deoxy-L-arabinose transferase-like glycosyltransferase